MKRQWPMCKAEALVDLLPNMLTKVNGQISLAEALVVENEKALAKKLTHTIT